MNRLVFGPDSAEGLRPNPPAITMASIAGLARLEFLVEMDAVAVVPEWDLKGDIMALL